MAFEDYMQGLRRRGNGLSGVGQAYFDTNVGDGRFAGQTFDAAQDFQSNVGAAIGAKDAPFGSIAARNDPSRYGSVFSRQNPGAAEALRDGGRMPRRSDAQQAAQLPTQPSAMDRYAAGMGYGDNGAFNPEGAGTYRADQVAHSTPNGTEYDPAAPNYSRGARRRSPRLLDFEVT